jgi:hypothetical protein
MDVGLHRSCSAHEGSFYLARGMNLTSLILEQFRFHFEFVGQFETRGLGWMKQSPKDTKECYFLGYKGNLQILARPFEQNA